MAEVNLAWATLRDVNKRRAYDRQLMIERAVCPRCATKGWVSGYVHGKYERRLVCPECEGAGFL
jgi:DnaJ-class molecular chaperone